MIRKNNSEDEFQIRLVQLKGKFLALTAREDALTPAEQAGQGLELQNELLDLCTEWQQITEARRPVGMEVLQSSPTPVERDKLKRRMAKLKLAMDELRPSLNETNVVEWTALYLEREALEERLGDDE